MIVIVAVVSVFVDIPIIYGYAFWVFLGASLLFLAMRYSRRG